MASINIYEYTWSLPAPVLGRLLNDRPELRRRLRLALNSFSYSSTATAPANLQYHVDRYGEQVTVDALGDILKYLNFQLSRGFGRVTPGGVPTILPPLATHPGDVKPSNTAISVVGEGLAGWHMAGKVGHGGRPLLPWARPIREVPDLVFYDRINTVALIQVKATLEPDVKGRLADAGVDLLQYAANEKHADPHTYYSCGIIGTIILPTADFDLHALQVEIT